MCSWFERPAGLYRTFEVFFEIELKRLFFEELHVDRVISLLALMRAALDIIWLGSRSSLSSEPAFVPTRRQREREREQAGKRREEGEPDEPDKRIDRQARDEMTIARQGGLRAGATGVYLPTVDVPTRVREREGGRRREGGGGESGVGRWQGTFLFFLSRAYDSMEASDSGRRRSIRCSACRAKQASRRKNNKGSKKENNRKEEEQGVRTDSLEQDASRSWNAAGTTKKGRATAYVRTHPRTPSHVAGVPPHRRWRRVRGVDGHLRGERFFEVRADVRASEDDLDRGRRRPRAASVRGFILQYPVDCLFRRGSVGGGKNFG